MKMDFEDKAAIAGLAIYGILIFINLAVFAGVVYVVWHFISKVW
jgi:hypothetical protein